MGRRAEEQLEFAEAPKFQRLEKRTKLPKILAVPINRLSRGKSKEPLESFAARLLADFGVPRNEILLLVGESVPIRRSAPEEVSPTVCQNGVGTKFQDAALMPPTFRRRIEKGF
ncbi:hypothetical protein [Hyphococcus luteus]|uniref:Uncharacterized protein n=1 Tax=Hyphococcus luteus TaxID=2058213 RepID=A0A2S7KB75_9PROT|nr:hypothetical protein [Marinicaulis flavus]PQA89733.1 hypothetical protein CW354_02435 [Marinicaulis flavus]